MVTVKAHKPDASWALNTALVCALFLVCFHCNQAMARPSAPNVICEVWPTTAACASGLPDCSTCHPAGDFNMRNSFGSSIEALLPTPLEINAFPEALRMVLPGLADEDADGDGHSNLTELEAGTAPGDPSSSPATSGCTESTNPQWNVCGYDPSYVFKRVYLDVCGYAPSYGDLEVFRALAPDDQSQQLSEALDQCLDSSFWQGKDGVLWRIAHKKIRPLGAVKSGAGSGAVPLADYDFDYALFAYTQIDNHDARHTLTGDYNVRYSDVEPRYQIINGDTQNPEPDRRAGLITTEWFMVINTMFTPVPRTTAAQAYRSYLGLDIARSEGLTPPTGNVCVGDDECENGACLNGVCLTDFDEKGITNEACSYCHSTLDPLSYPFSRYRGIAGGYTAAYAATRMNQYDPAVEGVGIRQVPEAGFLLGQPVADLVEWAEVAANSEAFAQSTVRDYWRLMIGHDPSPAQQSEFDALWRDLMEQHDYGVERMLHDLIRTEAYGVP